jgi:hypothetical protein
MWLTETATAFASTLLQELGKNASIDLTLPFFRNQARQSFGGQPGRLVARANSLQTVRGVAADVGDVDGPQLAAEIARFVMQRLIEYRTVESHSIQKAEGRDEIRGYANGCARVFERLLQFDG